jgi:glycosyltransferase involved in cell wall biosynthesis
MIRIAYLIDTIACDTAGTQKQLLETIRRLDPHVIRAHLVCLWESDWMRRNALPCDHTVLHYKGILKPSLPAVLHRLRGLIQRHRFQIVHTFFEDSIFVGYLAGMLSRPRPLLLSSRRDMGLGDANQPWYHKLYELALPVVNRSFAGIVTNSAQIKAYVAKREKTPASKIKVIYNGIEMPSAAEQIPKLLETNKADIWLAVVASLTPVKRHDLFLHAMGLLKAAAPGVSVKALLLGDGQEKSRLIHLARQLGVISSVVFGGAVENVADYLRCMHIGVLCSDREGLSNAIMEYMACGLPVIATAVGGNVELVDASNGICVPPGDPEALANALHRLIADQVLRKKLGRESYLKLARNYSWPKTISDLQAYYQALIASRGPR